MAMPNMEKSISQGVEETLPRRLLTRNSNGFPPLVFSVIYSKASYSRLCSLIKIGVQVLRFTQEMSVILTCHAILLPNPHTVTTALH